MIEKSIDLTCWLYLFNETIKGMMRKNIILCNQIMNCTIEYVTTLNIKRKRYRPLPNVKRCIN